jgi:hypothetical protein
MKWMSTGAAMKQGDGKDTNSVSTSEGPALSYYSTWNAFESGDERKKIQQSAHRGGLYWICPELKSPTTTTTTTATTTNEQQQERATTRGRRVKYPNQTTASRYQYIKGSSAMATSRSSIATPYYFQLLCL